MKNKPSQRLIATPSRTTEIMKRYDIKMKKSLGQNFLVEPQILQKMIDVGEIDDQTTVIEIGPGIGALTEFLALNAKEVLAFEIDPRFVDILGETLKNYNNVKVVHQDILKVNFQTEEYQFLTEVDRLVVVANLPYYITTPIIMHLIESQLPFDALVMMMQKEVAERMTAEVGSKAYNSLTIAIQYQMAAELAFIVPKTVFIPRPNVDSAVLKLTKLNTARVEVDDFKTFQEFVQAAFKQRRKTIWNNFKAAYISNGIVEENIIKECLEESGINPIRRGESLTIEEFADLYNIVQKKIQKL